jgi:hypothetical protein
MCYFFYLVFVMLAEISETTRLILSRISQILSLLVLGTPWMAWTGVIWVYMFRMMHFKTCFAGSDFRIFYNQNIYGIYKNEPKSSSYAFICVKIIIECTFNM